MAGATGTGGSAGALAGGHAPAQAASGWDRGGAERVAAWRSGRRSRFQRRFGRPLKGLQRRLGRRGRPPAPAGHGAAGSGGGSGSSGAAGSAPDGGCALVTGVLDFEDLAFSGAFQALPIPYVYNGFTLTNSTQSLEAVGSKSLRQYLNTTAVIADPASTTTLARTDGSPFTLLKIDLSAYNDGHPGIVLLTGTTPGGGGIGYDDDLAPDQRSRVRHLYVACVICERAFGLLTMNSADNAQYFDNISYSFCPGGSAPAGVPLAAAASLEARSRFIRKDEEPGSSSTALPNCCAAREKSGAWRRSCPGCCG